MANPQLEHGFVRIANEIWDEVIRRDFSKRQKDILFFIWRLSYGCRKTNAYIPKLVYFELAGIRKNHIKSELLFLEECKVIHWNKEERTFAVNKDYEQWQMAPVRGWIEHKFDEILALNIEKSSQNGNKKVPETGTKKLPNQELSDFDETEKLPKQELASSQNGNYFSEKVPETGTVMPPNPLPGAASELPKDIIKDIITDITAAGTEALTVNQDTGPPPPAAPPDFSFGRIYRIYEQHFAANGRVTEIEVEDLQDQYDTYGGEWLLKAMREAVRHNKRFLAYINGILLGYKERGGPHKEQPKKELNAGPLLIEVDDDPITQRMRQAWEAGDRPDAGHHDP